MNEFDELLKKYEVDNNSEKDISSKTEILVIDDDESMRRGLKSALTYKYDVTTADSGKKGIEILNKAFHCVILDVRMKDMSGFETYPKLKAKCPEVPIVFFTAFQSEHDLQEVINKFKPEGYVEKGRDISFLEHLIENAIKKYHLILENEEYKRDLEKKVEERTEELRQTHAQLLHSEKMASVGTLAVGVSHNFKNILESLNENTLLLIQDAKERMFHEAYLEKFDISEEDKNLLFNFLSLKYFENNAIAFVDGIDLMDRTRQLDKSFKDKGIEIGLRELRSLANCDIQDSDLGLLSDLAHKYTLSPILELISFSHRFGTQSRDVKTMIKRGKNIVENIMDITQLSEREDMLIDLNEVISEWLSSIKKDIKHVNIFERLALDLPEAKIDRKILINVLENLLANSLDALRTCKEDKYILVETYETECNLNIKFSDNGSGISKENITKIFDPFFTTKKGSGGTGLGLYTAYTLIGYYGQLKAQSDENQTSFLIEIDKGCCDNHHP